MMGIGFVGRLFRMFGRAGGAGRLALHWLLGRCAWCMLALCARREISLMGLGRRVSRAWLGGGRRVVRGVFR